MRAPEPAPLVFLNGELVGLRRARLPLLDRGYLYGEGLFETMRAYGGRIFALDRHLRRLLASAAELGLEIGVGEEYLTHALETTLRANHLSDAYLRLTVSQRCHIPGLEARAQGRSTVTVIAQSLAVPQPVSGLNAVILGPTSAPPPALARHKTLSFLAYVRARAAARAAGGDEALLVNGAGEITEAATANVFFAVKERLLTPPLECGLLPGVTRAIVLDLARAQGIDVAEQPLRASDAARCSECFLTNSIIELAPVTSINGHPVGSGQPGTMWSALATAYRKIIATADDA